MKYQTLKQLLLSILLLVCVMETAVPVGADDNPDVLLFTSPSCEYCQRVKEEFLPGFIESYGSLIDVVELDVSVQANLDSLFALEDLLNVPESEKEYPVMYFMGSILEGEIRIRMQLDDLVEAYIADPDSMRAVESGIFAGRTPAPVQPEITNARPVAMAYFSKHGCSECARALELIGRMKTRFDFLTVDEFDIADRTSKLLAVKLAMRSGMPENNYLGTPVMFIGDTYIFGDEITTDNVSAVITSSAATGTESFWRDYRDADFAEAESKLRELFSSFTIIAVALAGLVDGFNPCAFASIIFFVSYLGMIGRKGRDIILVGMSFAGAVFLTYFLLGIGFSTLLRQLSHLEMVSKIIFGGTGLLCIAFGVVSIGDYFKARRGNTTDMSLQLPAFLKRRIHTAIRENVKTKSFVVGAFATGFFVSLLELACTGQVYLPTITLIIRNEGVASLATMYLLLYNICFILPLLAVFGIVYFGVSSRAIARVMETRVGAVKLGLAVVFFILGCLLIWTVL